MPRLATASDVYQIHAKRQQRRIQTYLQVLARCQRRIISAAEMDQFETMFAVPAYLVGEPLFNLKTCLIFLMMKLRRIGFQVSFVAPNHLHISWRRYS